MPSAIDQFAATIENVIRRLQLDTMVGFGAIHCAVIVQDGVIQLIEIEPKFKRKPKQRKGEPITAAANR